MSNDKLLLCCCDLATLSTSPSPFSRIVALGYYDGFLSGVVSCDVCSTAYRVEILDMDDDQNNRIFSLASLATGLFNALVESISRYETPKWPFWCPQYQFGSEEDRALVRNSVFSVLEQADTPNLIIASDSWLHRILAAKKVTLEELNSAADWFSLLSLARDESGTPAPSPAPHADHRSDNERALLPESEVRGQ